MTVKKRKKSKTKTSDQKASLYLTPRTFLVFVVIATKTIFLWSYGLPSITSSKPILESEKIHNQLSTIPRLQHKNKINIFVWKRPFGFPFYNFDSCGDFSNCYFTYPDKNGPTKKELVKNASAVIFQTIFDKTLISKIEDLNSIRRPDQPFIFYQMESPFFHKDSMENFDGFFNWSLTFVQENNHQVLNIIFLLVSWILTYREGSAFWLPYGSAIQEKLKIYHSRSLRKHLGLPQNPIVSPDQLTDSDIDKVFSYFKIQ